jgi:hypothetical protein
LKCNDPRLELHYRHCQVHFCLHSARCTFPRKARDSAPRNRGTRDNRIAIARFFPSEFRRALSQFAGHSFVNRGQLKVEEFAPSERANSPVTSRFWLRSILLVRFIVAAFAGGRKTPSQMTDHPVA